MEPGQQKASTEACVPSLSCSWLLARRWGAGTSLFSARQVDFSVRYWARAGVYAAGGKAALVGGTFLTCRTTNQIARLGCLGLLATGIEGRTTPGAGVRRRRHPKYLRIGGAAQARRGLRGEGDQGARGAAARRQGQGRRREGARRREARRGEGDGARGARCRRRHREEIEEKIRPPPYGLARHGVVLARSHELSSQTWTHRLPLPLAPAGSTRFTQDPFTSQVRFTQPEPALGPAQPTTALAAPAAPLS